MIGNQKTIRFLEQLRDHIEEKIKIIDKQIEDIDNCNYKKLNSLDRLAVEFGYRQCEQDVNIKETLNKYEKSL